MDEHSGHGGEGDRQVARLVERLAPELAEAPRRRAAQGFHKQVVFVGDAHVLRIPRQPGFRGPLETERRVLGRIEGRLCLPTPRVVAVDPESGADLCVRAPGEALDWRAWGRLGPAARTRASERFGRFLAELHLEVDADEAAALGVSPAEPPDADALRARLAHVLRAGRRALLLEATLDAIPRLRAPVVEPRLLHGDLSHHNIGYDLETSRPVGVFDFGMARVGDPHRDLRYDPGLERADPRVVDEYVATGGPPISRARQRAWHAWSALDNLAHSLAHEGPELQAARWGWVDAVAAWDPASLEED